MQEDEKWLTEETLHKMRFFWELHCLSLRDMKPGGKGTISYNPLPTQQVSLEALKEETKSVVDDNDSLYVALRKNEETFSLLHQIFGHLNVAVGICNGVLVCVADEVDEVTDFISEHCADSAIWKALMRRHMREVRHDRSKVWCENDACVTQYEKWIAIDPERIKKETFHCSVPDCHKLVWSEKDQPCCECNSWYCTIHWQTSGSWPDYEWCCALCSGG